MKFERRETPSEIQFTYRPGDWAEPVELVYQRSLPQRMVQPEPPAEAKFPRYPARRGHWGVRLFVGITLLVALVSLGIGVWYLQQYGLSLPGQPGGAGEGDGQYEDPFYWEERYDEQARETTIDRYRPFGGSVVTLALQPAAEEAQPLTAGEIFDTLRPSTVTVLGENDRGYSVGTGIIFDEAGYILTNDHVISGCSACTVLVTDQYGVDQEYEARLVGGDADQDLAVLKIEAQGLVPAQFGVSDQLAVGDKVYAIGNPLGWELRGTFTDGIVSAVDREVDVDGVSMTLIQTNTALNSGNSGGPLINQYGQVVGINTIKMMSGYDTIEGLGFAIPTSLACRWVNEIIRYGEIQPQPVLGVMINRIPETLPDGTTGLQVSEVTAGGSGDLAGLRPGDYIVAFAGERVYRTEDILHLRRNLSVGDNILVRIWRDGEYLDLKMTMRAAE